MIYGEEKRGKNSQRFALRDGAQGQKIPQSTPFCGESDCGTSLVESCSCGKTGKHWGLLSESGNKVLDQQMEGGGGGGGNRRAFSIKDIVRNS